MPLIKNQRVKSWINSDKLFEDILMEVTQKITESTKDFDLEIEEIYIEDAYPDEKGDLEEFVIEVKVPSGTDIYEINKFWNDIGYKTTEFLDSVQDHPKIRELDEKLLIIVSEGNI